MYAAQAAGCAPLVEAPVERPDSICGSLKLPDPAGSGAVAVLEERLLVAATELSERGVPSNTTGGAALAVLSIAPDETVVVIDHMSVDRKTDPLRRH